MYQLRRTRSANIEKEIVRLYARASMLNRTKTNKVPATEDRITAQGFPSTTYPFVTVVDDVANELPGRLTSVFGPDQNEGGGVLGPGVMGRDVLGVFSCERLWARCARTRWPAASALMSESSPAMTAAAMMRASCCEFWPGLVGCAPLMPSISRTAPCGARMVPPPTVPTSIDGIDTVINKSSPLLVLSIHVSLNYARAPTWKLTIP